MSDALQNDPATVAAPTDPALGSGMAGLVWSYVNEDPHEVWFAERRWGDGGPICPSCGGAGKRIYGNWMPYRCTAKGCYKFFSVKTGTFMHSSNHSYQKWREIWRCVRGRLGRITPTVLAHEVGLGIYSASAILARIHGAVREGSWVPYSVEELRGD